MTYGGYHEMRVECSAALGVAVRLRTPPRSPIATPLSRRRRPSHHAGSPRRARRRRGAAGRRPRDRSRPARAPHRPNHPRHIDDGRGPGQPDHQDGALRDAGRGRPRPPRDLGRPVRGPRAAVARGPRRGPSRGGSGSRTFADMRPLVGITTSLNRTDAGVLEQRLDLRYVRAVERAGGLPLLAPMLDDDAATDAFADLVDALVVSGGPGRARRTRRRTPGRHLRDRGCPRPLRQAAARRVPAGAPARPGHLLRDAAGERPPRRHDPRRRRERRRRRHAQRGARRHHARDCALGGHPLARDRRPRWTSTSTRVTCRPSRSPGATSWCRPARPTARSRPSSPRTARLSASSSTPRRWSLRSTPCSATWSLGPPPRAFLGGNLAIGAVFEGT